MNYGKSIVRKNIFEFLKEIIPGTDNFTFINNYIGFQEILSGEIYAIDGDNLYLNELPESIYIGIVSEKIIRGDGSGFLFKKIE